MSEETGPVGGPIGSYGPNDKGYAAGNIELAAKHIQRAIAFDFGGGYCSHLVRDLPADHDLEKALFHLKQYYSSICKYANTTIEEKADLFNPK